jgi:hypothetical protein
VARATAPEKFARSTRLSQNMRDLPASWSLPGLPPPAEPGAGGRRGTNSSTPRCPPEVFWKGWQSPQSQLLTAAQSALQLRPSSPRPPPPSLTAPLSRPRLVNYLKAGFGAHRGGFPRPRPTAPPASICRGLLCPQGWGRLNGNDSLNVYSPAADSRAPGQVQGRDLAR